MAEWKRAALWSLSSVVPAELETVWGGNCDLRFFELSTDTCSVQTEAGHRGRTMSSIIDKELNPETIGWESNSYRLLLMTSSPSHSYSSHSVTQEESQWIQIPVIKALMDIAQGCPQVRPRNPGIRQEPSGRESNTRSLSMILMCGFRFKTFLERRGGGWQPVWGRCVDTSVSGGGVPTPPCFHRDNLTDGSGLLIKARRNSWRFWHMLDELFKAKVTCWAEVNCRHACVSARMQNVGAWGHRFISRGQVGGWSLRVCVPRKAGAPVYICTDKLPSAHLGAGGVCGRLPARRRNFKEIIKSSSFDRWGPIVQHLWSLTDQGKRTF